VEITSDLPDDPVVTIQTCKWGFCYTLMEKDYDICKSFSSGDNGESCPESGSYSFSKDVDIPDLGYDLSGSFNIKIMVGDSDGSSSSSCSVTIAASGYSAQMAFSLVGTVMLLTCAAQAVKRRRRTTTVEDHTEDLLEGSNFEMMKDPAVLANSGAMA